MTDKATGEYLQTINNDGLHTQIEEAWKAYHGTLPDPIRVTSQNRPNDNVKTNHCKIAADTIVAFLFGNEISVVLDEDTPDERNTEEKWLDNVFKFNRFDLLLQKLGLNGTIAGHAFIKIQLGKPFPKLIVLDPAKVRVQTAPDDTSVVECYTVYWGGIYKGEKALYRQRIEHSSLTSVAGADRIFFAHTMIGSTRSPVTDPQTTEVPHWRIVDQVSTKNTTNYTQGRADTDWETLAVDIWPYPFAPIVDCQNKIEPNKFWGSPDISPDVIAIQKNINRALTNINKILRIHAHPKTYATGVTSDQLQSASVNPEDILSFPNPEAKLNVLEMLSDLSSSLNYYKELKDAFHELVRVPEIAIGKTENVGQLSGLALKILYGALIQATNLKRILYGYLITELSYRLLFINSPDIRVSSTDDLFLTNQLWEPKVIWPELLPEDAEAVARTLLLDIQMGVSKETALRKRGYDPKVERILKEAEDKIAMAKAQANMDALTRGQVPGIDPLGRDLNASNGGSDDE